MAVGPALAPLSPHGRLVRVLRALADTLPDEVAPLLAASRFRAGGAALSRLADEAHLEAAVGAVAPEEASWLAAQLLARWQRLRPVSLPPAVTIVAPAEVALEALAAPVTISLAGEGLLPGWSAAWHGAEAAADGASAVVTVPARPSEAPTELRVRVHVHGRAEAGGARCALVAQATIRVRRT